MRNTLIIVVVLWMVGAIGIALGLGEQGLLVLMGLGLIGVIWMLAIKHKNTMEIALDRSMDEIERELEEEEGKKKDKG